MVSWFSLRWGFSILGIVGTSGYLEAGLGAHAGDWKLGRELPIIYCDGYISFLNSKSHCCSLCRPLYNTFPARYCLLPEF
jgi:hypothetical protein